MPDDFDERVKGVASLGEPVRRALYRYVVTQDGAVSRDAAAEGVGVARHVAKFHLDRLEEDGLLEAEFRRPPGRGGPGAGRPAKLYRRSGREVSVSLPDRRYGLAGHLMAGAITRAAAGEATVADALREASLAFGREIGAGARAQAGGAVAGGRAAAVAAEVLAEYGYEPRQASGELLLANCPFHALAQEYTELVCGMNLGICEGMVAELAPDALSARLDPAPDRCCVVIGRPEAESGA